MTEQDETEARCWFSHSWHEAYSLHTVWCPLQRAGFTHLVHFFKFKLSTLILPASMREFNDGHRMSLQYKFHKKGKKKKKKAEKQMFKFHWNNNEQTTTMCALKSLAYLHWMPCSLTWKSNLSLDTQTCLWFNLWPMRGI